MELQTEIIVQISLIEKRQQNKDHETTYLLAKTVRKLKRNNVSGYAIIAPRNY